MSEVALVGAHDVDRLDRPRGVVLLDDGQVAVRRLRTPGVPPPGQLLIQVLAVGVCGTDAALALGHRAAPHTPWLLGHEAVGEIRALGGGTEAAGWRVGQRVVLEPNQSDLTCAECRAGNTSRCSQRRSSGVLTQPGFMTDLVIHPAQFTHAAPGEATIEDLVCVEPLSVAVAAVRRSGIGPGQSACVLGAGAQGQFAAQLLRSLEITPWVVDLCPDRVGLAVEHGARPLPNGAWSVDHLFDTTGSPEALAAQIEHLRPGGTVTVVGESHHPMRISSFQLVQRQLTLKGSFIYDHPHDFAHALDLISHGAVQPGAVLRPASSITDAAEILADLHNAAGKPWIDLRLPVRPAEQ